MVKLHFYKKYILLSIYTDLDDRNPSYNPLSFLSIIIIRSLHDFMIHFEAELIERIKCFHE